MINVPAFCDKCGTVFSSGIGGEATGVSFKNCKAGPCPRCGSTGHIPDGVFNFIGNTIEILSAPTRTIDELTKLAKIVNEARENNESPGKISNKIQTELPGLSKLADYLPQNRNELYGFLGVLLATITLLLQLGHSQGKSTNITINQVVNQTYLECGPTNEERRVPRVVPKKPGRNDPCSCGSGKKYKKCCGTSH